MNWKLLAGLVFGLGLLIGWLSSRLGYVHFNERIDLGPVLNAVATLTVAILIGYLYNKQASTRRVETDLLLDGVKDAKNAFRKLEEAALPCSALNALDSEQQSLLITAERDLSNAIHSLEQALKYCKVMLPTLEFEKLKEARAALKDSLTDDPFPGPYPPFSRAQISSAFKTTRDQLTRMGFAINRR